MLTAVERYYTRKLLELGPTHSGVDWNSAASQNVRFEQLIKIIPDGLTFTINDYGCGYGALITYMTERALSFRYCGFDISREMVAVARRLHEGRQHCDFATSEEDLSPAEFTVASGVFNVKLDAAVPDWERYVLGKLGVLNDVSRKGFAFNVLSAYSDSDHHQSKLYYADPRVYFDYCKRSFSRNVTLLHDYDLYEFTILVKK